MTCVTTLKIQIDSSYSIDQINTLVNVKDLVSKLGVATLSEHGTIVCKRMSERDKVVRAEYEMTIEIHHVSIEIAGQPRRLALAGRHMKTYVDGGLIEGLLKEDLDALTVCAKAARLQEPWRLPNVSTVLSTFFSSSANRSVLSKAETTPLSVSYTEAVNLSLRRIFRANALWCRLAVVAIASAAAFLTFFLKLQSYLHVGLATALTAATYLGVRWKLRRSAAVVGGPEFVAWLHDRGYEVGPITFCCAAIAAAYISFKIGGGA